MPTGHEVGTVTTVSGEILALFMSFYTSKKISKPDADDRSEQGGSALAMVISYTTWKSVGFQKLSNVKYGYGMVIEM